jgi:hypothetical protein
MGTLLVGVEKVTYLIDRCKIYEILYLYDMQTGQAMEDSKSALMQADQAMANLESALVALYAAMLSFLALANRLYDKNITTRTIHALLNPNEVADFISKCQTLEEWVNIEAESCEHTCRRIAHAKLDQCMEKLKELLVELREPIIRVDCRVAALWDRSTQSEHSNILRWASDIPYEDNHYAAREGRTAGTGQWLLMHDRYREWRGSSASMMLWLHGSRKCCVFVVG